MRIYIASSWKNEHGVTMLTEKLRELDKSITVVSWVEQNYGEGYGAQKPINFEEWVKTPSAAKSFLFDTNGAAYCDVLVYYGPAGKDAAAECGIAYGHKQEHGYPYMIGIYAKGEDFGLMRKMFDVWCDKIETVVSEIIFKLRGAKP